MAVPRRPPARFQPHFTIGLLYLVAFFFAYCFLLAAPELYPVLRDMPPGPEQQEEAQRVTRETVRPRLWIAGAAALATTGIAAYAGVLPGMRARR